MAAPKSIGAIELSSIALGYRVQDAMLDAADVEILIARTICSGKYLIVVGGSVSDVRAAIRAGLNAPDEAVIDHLVIPNVHESVFPALGQSVTIDADEPGALGVVETFSGVSILAAADAAAKAARVQLFRIHDCHAGVAAAAAEARQRGLLVAEVVIPRPNRELFGEYL
jgi:microcompartment protein CcmL/EutN